MDLTQAFKNYKEHVKAVLEQFPVDVHQLNRIAVFKALAELLYEQRTLSHTSGYQVVSRDDLQQQVTLYYPAHNLSKRQEVNKYLSQSFSHSNTLEPDFIEFTFTNDDTLYLRTDVVEGGSPKHGYRIRDFDHQAELIEYLCQLDLTLFFIPADNLSLASIFERYLYPINLKMRA
ncbi:hypothetical protein QWY97_02220 [Vibrio cortegadensis]|uniref:hypothetical protein n=1 Tax=Vibrio cortegadensis TaxID=1328770 RepID=UPI0021C3811D|nr:hypothetical protein [Vibrio cortegadensis]MDN3696170.1 hypothetical protein [Vibrio cortegadensis]